MGKDVGENSPREKGKQETRGGLLGEKGKGTMPSGPMGLAKRRARRPRQTPGGGRETNVRITKKKQRRRVTYT